jgi:biotin-dependent carboxylase-like uncharacterized protein
MRAIRILETGWLSSIQDDGRAGWGHLGVPPSGAIDIALAAQMNRIVGNPEHFAVIETAGDLVVEACSDLLLASSDTGALRSVRKGQHHRVHRGHNRNLSYLAVRGGIAAPQVLGSASQDQLSGLGPGTLDVGSLWAVGPEPSGEILVDQVAIAPLDTRIRLWPGPHLDVFAPTTWELLVHGPWSTSGVMDRIGVRLDGPRLTQASQLTIASEPLLCGAIQLPPDGRPIVMLRDHPTTGGYPVVAVVDPRDLHLIAQSPPGITLQMVPYGTEGAARAGSDGL